MTRDENIAATTETLEYRARALRKMVREELPPLHIRQQLDLCAQGIVAVKQALDSTDAPPPLVKTGQGSYERVYPAEDRPNEHV